jgi:hypothetical protein
MHRDLHAQPSCLCDLFEPLLLFEAVLKKAYNEHSGRAAKANLGEKRQLTKSLVSLFHFFLFVASPSSPCCLCMTSCSHCSILKYMELMCFMHSYLDKCVRSRPSGHMNAPVCTLKWAEKLYTLPGADDRPARDGLR